MVARSITSSLASAFALASVASSDGVVVGVVPGAAEDARSLWQRYAVQPGRVVRALLDQQRRRPDRDHRGDLELCGVGLARVDHVHRVEAVRVLGGDALKARREAHQTRGAGRLAGGLVRVEQRALQGQDEVAAGQQGQALEAAVALAGEVDAV
jgi:hypothetical protein